MTTEFFVNLKFNYYFLNFTEFVDTKDTKKKKVSFKYKKKKICQQLMRKKMFNTKIK